MPVRHGHWKAIGQRLGLDKSAREAETIVASEVICPQLYSVDVYSRCTAKRLLDDFMRCSIAEVLVRSQYFEQPSPYSEIYWLAHLRRPRLANQIKPDETDDTGQQ